MAVPNDKSKVLIDDSSLEDNSGEEEEDEFRDEHQKPLIECDSSPVENVIPLSIGKIKIFKPRRRNRFLIKKYFKLCSIISVIIFFTIYLYRLKDSLYLSDNTLKTSQTNCDQLTQTLIWNKTFPMLTIESALRLVDIDNDTILDVIVPFGTGLDASSYDTMSCQIYFNQTKDDGSSTSWGCGGGVMAVNGRTGQQMWVRYTPHELFASNCNIDINGDGIKDCILGGRMAGLYAVDGSTGGIIWQIDPNIGDPIVETSNFYTPLFVPRDIDQDKIPDIVVIHGGDPLRKPNERTRIVARILVMSSKTGQILSWVTVPGEAESYYSPQLLFHPDKTLILYGTGGETHGGALYAISFEDLYEKRIEKSRVIYKDCCKGVMVPPVLIDINDDDVLDLIMSLFNSTVIAFDGLTFKEIWRTEFPKSETYSTPAVGYFNNDTTPDFAVLYQYGPGFPIYYRAQFTVLDGKNGKQLMETPVDMLIGTQSSPLTISTTSKNDLFLYWYSSCQLYENITSIEDSIAQQFKIAPGTTTHETSRADFCKLRYNSTLFTQFRALSPTNSTTLYDSRDYNISKPINYTAIGLKWIEENVDQNAFSDNKVQESDMGQQVYLPSYQQQYPVRRRDPYSDSIFDRNYDTQPLNYDRIFNSRRRYKRHVGVHDGGGIQRVISTGTLAPPINKDLNTIDIIFATFWFPPSKNVRIMTPEVENCISRLMDPREEERLRFKEDTYFKRLKLDHDNYEELVRDICSQHNDKLIQRQTNSVVNNLVKDMGEMTLFRLNLKCVSDQKSTKVGAIKEFSKQMWPSYMGANADSIANLDDNPFVITDNIPDVKQ